MNKVILSGHITRDIETKYTQNNTAWVGTGIAVSRQTKDKTADFFNLIAWGKTAEIMGKYLSKGSKILLEGHLQFNQYEAKDGTKKNSVNVVVETFEFMDSKSNGRKQSNNNDDLGFDPNDMPL